MARKRKGERKKKHTQSTLFLHRVHHILTACAAAGSPVTPTGMLLGRALHHPGESRGCAQVGSMCPEGCWSCAGAGSSHSLGTWLVLLLHHRFSAPQWLAQPGHRRLVPPWHGRCAPEDRSHPCQWTSGFLCSQLWTLGCSFI